MSETSDAAPGAADLDERKEAVLRAIIEEYVASAQPVGSQRVARAGALTVSSATVRNDMAALERDGFIHQPHTSAGRIPTERGYRYFVDHLTQPGLAPAARRRVADFFRTTHHALEDLLHETSQLLARITAQASVVVGPSHRRAEVRGVQIVELPPRVVLVVAVLSDGKIAREVLNLADDVSGDRVAAASALLDDTLRGCELGDLPEPRRTGDAATDDLVAAARNALSTRPQSGDEPVFVGGTGNLVAEHDAFGPDATAEVLELLEQQVVVVTLVRRLLDEGITVRIGSESEVEALRDCSLVLASYRIGGEPAGTVGVLGPTRMDYRRVVAAVDAVSRQLDQHLS